MPPAGADTKAGPSSASSSSKREDGKGDSKKSKAGKDRKDDKDGGKKSEKKGGEGGGNSSSVGVKSRDASPKKEKGSKVVTKQAPVNGAAGINGRATDSHSDPAAVNSNSHTTAAADSPSKLKPEGKEGDKDKDKDTDTDKGGKKEIAGTKKGKKDEDKEEKRKRVASRWWRGYQKVVLNYREDQLSRLKDFQYIKVEVQDSAKTKFSGGKRRPADILAGKSVVCSMLHGRTGRGMEILRLFPFFNLMHEFRVCDVMLTETYPISPFPPLTLLPRQNPENMLKEKLKKQQEYVFQENIRHQKRIGHAHYQLGDYYKALSFFERVCLNEALVEENEDQKAKRLKAEQVARDLAKVEELQKRLNTKKLKGRKAEEMRQAELDKQVRLAKEAKAAEKEKRRKAKLGQSDPEEEEEEEIDPSSKDYRVHLMAGRCCMRLFDLTKQHYHLDKAYAHLTHSVECMTVPRPGYDMSTMLRLPVVLLELGRVYEGYGAHNSALEMYSKIMQEYPHSRCYFDTMYRAALVGKYLSDHSQNDTTKQEMLNRCIDMLQFLLEALPHTLNETQTIFLYAKCLEKSSDPAIRYRAKAAYESLFLHCQQIKIANAHNFKVSYDWEKEAENWQLLAENICDQHEPLVAKEGFETYVAKVNSRRMPGKELSTYIDMQTLIQIALNYSHFQNFKEATKYADMALSKDRLNPQVRALISKWSKPHADKLAKEVNSVNTLHARWTERAWTETARAKLKAQEILRLESLYKSDRFNKEARQLLSYYARDEWRAKFLFESACAVRVQRFVRNKFVCWKVQERFRSVYLSRAGQAYTMFNRRPYDRKLRQEIRDVCKSRFCPRKHAIRKVRNLVERQDEAAACMSRSFRAYRTRRQIMTSIINTKRKRDDKLNQCAVTLQCLVRMKLATIKVQLEIIQWARKAVAAKVIQQYIRWRNKTFQHAAWKLIYKRRAVQARAMETFLIVFTYNWKRKQYRKQLYFAERQAALIKAERIRQYTVALKFRNESVVKMQRFFRSCRARLLSIIASRTIRARRATGYSQSSDHVIREYFSNQAKGKYIPPGVRVGTPQYIAALQQPQAFITSTIVTDGNGNQPSSARGGPTFKNVADLHAGTENIIQSPFLSADIMMLSSLLRNKDCAVKALILHELDTGYLADYEFDLLPALAACRSLREIRILGGTFTSRFLTAVHNVVQVENARVVQLFCERVRVMPNRGGTGGEASGSRASSSSGSISSLNKAEREEEDRIQRLWQAGTTTEKERAAAKEIGYTEKDVRSKYIAEGEVDDEELEKMQRIYMQFQKGSKALTATLVGGMARLIQDYFNYSLPGIKSISLHGSSIRDSDLELLCSGIYANTSLKSIYLSLNILTDFGFLEILKSLQRNKKSNVEHIDVSNNLIALGRDARQFLDKWQPPNPAKAPTLHMNLIGNSLVRDYPEPIKAKKKKDPSNYIVASIAESSRKIPPLLIITSFRVAMLPSGVMDPAQFYGYVEPAEEMLSSSRSRPNPYPPANTASKRGTPAKSKMPYEQGPSLNTNKLVAKELMQMQSLALKPLAFHSSYNNNHAINAANEMHLMREGLEEKKDIGADSRDSILRTKSAGNPANNMSGV